jgi:hypothetical protein
MPSFYRPMKLQMSVESKRFAEGICVVEVAISFDSEKAEGKERAVKKSVLLSRSYISPMAALGLQAASIPVEQDLEIVSSDDESLNDQAKAIAQEAELLLFHRAGSSGGVELCVEQSATSLSISCKNLEGAGSDQHCLDQRFHAWAQVLSLRKATRRSTQPASKFSFISIDLARKDGVVTCEVCAFGKEDESYSLQESFAFEEFPGNTLVAELMLFYAFLFEGREAKSYRVFFNEHSESLLIGELLPNQISWLFSTTIVNRWGAELDERVEGYSPSDELSVLAFVRMKLILQK